jgi:hypothetical protein
MVKMKIKKLLEQKLPGFFEESNSTKINKIRLFSGNFRILPDFIIIGVQKCGTTSLYNYLTQHPEIESAISKQPHYFDINFGKKIIWYKSHFPLYIKKVFYKKILKKQFITGEASTDYINHPLVSKRIKESLPNVKIIIILRNPVKRTCSHYQMNKKTNDEKLPILSALKKDLEQRPKKEKEVKEKGIFFSEYFKKFEYLGRGEYVRQIEEWEKLFPKNQILILKLEDLENKPQDSLNEIFRFLNVKNHKFKKFNKQNVGKYDKIEPKVETFLEDYFKPYNKILFEKYGIKF